MNDLIVEDFNNSIDVNKLSTIQISYLSQSFSFWKIECFYLLIWMIFYQLDEYSYLDKYDFEIDKN